MKNPGVKDHLRRIAKKVAKKAKAREIKLERYQEDDERVDKPQRSWQMRIEFADSPHLGSSVIRMDGLAVGYTPAVPLLTNVNLLVKNGRRIAITGPNGEGKTTLLRTILGEIQPLAEK